MPDLPTAEYEEIVIAASALITGWQRSDQELIDHALKRLRNLIAPEVSDATAVPVGVGLTRRQHDALAFIEWYCGEHGFSPSYQEIGTGIGVRAKSGVNRIVLELVERKRIRMLPNQARSIGILAPLTEQEKRS